MCLAMCRSVGREVCIHKLRDVEGEMKVGSKCEWKCHEEEDHGWDEYLEYVPYKAAAGGRYSAHKRQGSCWPESATPSSQWDDGVTASLNIAEVQSVVQSSSRPVVQSYRPSSYLSTQIRPYHFRRHSIQPVFVLPLKMRV